MAISAAQQQHAWKVLAGTKRRLSDLPDRRGTNLSVVFGRGVSRKEPAKRQPMYSGYSLAAARAKLLAEGWQAAVIEEALHGTIVGNFRRFAASWAGYVGGRGWFNELLQMDDAERGPIIGECRLESIWETVQQGQQSLTALLSDLGKLATVADEAKALEARREEPGSPIRYFLERRYGLPAELSLAVMKCNQAVPWWVFIVLAVLAVLCGWLFWLAIVDPQNAAFQSAGGVGWLHYTVVPLFAVAMVGVDVWLIIDRPRRERDWREQLQRYVESGPVGPGGGQV